MRRPFILFLILISIYCWLADCFNLLFYALKIDSSNIKVYCSVFSVLVLTSFFFIVKKLFYKTSSLPSAGSLFKGGTRKEWLLLFIVSLPVIILGIFRAVYPDQNYDTLHYELYVQEYDFKDNSINFAAGSIRTYFFPLAERVFAIFRHVLGFRLGTILNTILLVTIIFSIYDFIKKVFTVYLPDMQVPRIAVALFSLFSIFSENTLFTIGSYKTDLIGVPLTLELIHIVFFHRHSNAKRLQHYYFFLVASLTLAYKLTYLPYVGIIALIYLVQHYKEYTKIEFITLPFVVFLFPGSYLLYNIAETGNPVFPLYNDIFQSSLYPVERFKDLRWGHRKVYEIFTFHIVTYFDKARCNEWSLYSYRLLAGYLISLAGILAYFIKHKKNRSIPFLRFMLYISILAILFDYACVVTTGYFRYGSLVEVLYGVIIVLWFLYLYKKVTAAVIFMIIFLQSFTTFDNIYEKNINLSWHDYKQFITDKTVFRNNARLLLNDYNDIVDANNVLAGVDGFVNLEPFPQDGLAKILGKKVPIYDLQPGSRTPELTQQAENTIRTRAGKEKLMTVASIEALNTGIIKSLNARGFLVSNMYEVYPSFFRFGEPVFLLQIRYLDTSKYAIKASEHYLRDENPQESRNDIAYNTGNKLKVFIREAPFTFSWHFLPNEYEISINEKKYSTKNRFGKNKILTTEGIDLKIHKPNSVPYLIIIQEIEEKKKL